MLEKPPRPDRFVAALERRQAYLAERIRMERATPYDKAEHAALGWAIPQIKKPPANGSKEP